MNESMDISNPSSTEQNVAFQTETLKQICYVQQISMKEYEQQGTVYTQQSLRELTSSPEFKQHNQKCKLCSSCWYHGNWSPGCEECGGFAMKRPCPICHGKCGAVWLRSVDMSHSMEAAHWNGQCLLPVEQQSHFLRNIVQMNHEDLPTALNDMLINKQ